METSTHFQQLYLFKGKEYSLYKTGLPDSVIESINSLCMSFEVCSEETRREITSYVTREISYLFLMFSDRAALEALHRKDEECIVRGLEALTIENCKVDWRDSTLRLAPLYHSAVSIGADPERLIASVAAIAVEPAKTQLLLSFLERSPENRELAKFGLKETLGTDGNVFYTSRFG
ncbi:MAG: hypothetical protein WA634_12495 [Silvibacterium sp.]